MLQMANICDNVSLKNKLNETKQTLSTVSAANPESTSMLYD